MWIPSPRSLSLLCLLVAPALLAGCTARSTLPLHSLESGVYAFMNDADTRVFVVEDAEAFALLYREIHTGHQPQPEPPAVDFTAKRVLVAFMGRRFTGGYAVGFPTRADLQRETVTVELDWHEPPDDALVTQAITSPYALVLLPRGEYRRIEVLRDGDPIGVIDGLTPLR